MEYHGFAISRSQGSLTGLVLYIMFCLVLLLFCSVNAAIEVAVVPPQVLQDGASQLALKEDFTVCDDAVGISAEY